MNLHDVPAGERFVNPRNLLLPPDVFTAKFPALLKIQQGVSRVPKTTESLSRREREMMNIIFARGQASATEVMEAMAEAPSYSAVRATLRILEQTPHDRCGLASNVLIG